MKDDRLTLVYAEGNIRVELGKILTNKSISIDDALNILGIDMDAFADKQGWDGWNYESLKLIYPGSIATFVGKWWNDRSIEVWEIGGTQYALSGWNGERYLNCWEVVDGIESGAKAVIEPIYNKIGEDEFEIVDYKVVG